MKFKKGDKVVTRLGNRGVVKKVNNFIWVLLAAAKSHGVEYAYNPKELRKIK